MTRLPGALYLAEEAITSLVRIVAESPAMSGQAWPRRCRPRKRTSLSRSASSRALTPLARVVAVDLGIKSRTPYHLCARSARPMSSPPRSLLPTLVVEPRRRVLFNGPGDPSTADREVGVLRAVLDAGIPYFGICFGHQLFWTSPRLGTYKLNYGHRGINQPVKDLRPGVEITAHNHGFLPWTPHGFGFCGAF